METWFGVELHSLVATVNEVLTVTQDVELGPPLNEEQNAIHAPYLVAFVEYTLVQTDVVTELAAGFVFSLAEVRFDTHYLFLYEELLNAVVEYLDFVSPVVGYLDVVSAVVGYLDVVADVAN